MATEKIMLYMHIIVHFHVFGSKGNNFLRISVLLLLQKYEIPLSLPKTF